MAWVDSDNVTFHHRWLCQVNAWQATGSVLQSNYEKPR